MDKDFIKIDDLLRQRLGGGEETERSGSWLNMRELLDKEMPQEKPAGIMYWRRTFGVVAALSLVAAIGIGWYQYSTAYNNQGTGNDRAIADMVNGRVSNGPVSGNDAGAVYQTSEQAGNNSAQPAVAGKAMHNATVANNMQSANASTSANQSNTTTNTPNSNVAATNIANNNGVSWE